MRMSLECLRNTPHARLKRFAAVLSTFSWIKAGLNLSLVERLSSTSQPAHFCRGLVASTVRDPWRISSGPRFFHKTVQQPTFSRCRHAKIAFSATKIYELRDSVSAESKLNRKLAQHLRTSRQIPSIPDFTLRPLTNMRPRTLCHFFREGSSFSHRLLSNYLARTPEVSSCTAIREQY
jgi:hypothetical protein